MVKSGGQSACATRNAGAVKALATELAESCSRPWTLMEVCGGQTHAIVRAGLDQLLPEGVRLIHGPGCPVCVTPAGTIEQALQLARRKDVILCSYGDMLRVPGEGRETLLSVRAAGGDVRLLTSPLQALELARRNPQRQVVFLAVGFETTAPATALLARQALALGATNLSLLTAHVRVSPAMGAILANPDNRVQAFLAAGHVCSVLGTAELEQLVERWRVPVVVSGFEPMELMAGVLASVRQLEAGQARVENAYGVVVRAEGNPEARRLLEEVFEPCDRPWRGLGWLAGGGLALRSTYRALDAMQRFGLQEVAAEATPPCCDPHQPTPAAMASTALSHQIATADGQGCIAGSILRGLATPKQCPSFGTTCTPEQPLGAPMVSSEGACAAYFLYRRHSGTPLAGAGPEAHSANAARC